MNIKLPIDTQCANDAADCLDHIVNARASANGELVLTASSRLQVRGAASVIRDLVAERDELTRRVEELEASPQ